MVRNGLESAFAEGHDVPDRFVDDVNDMTYSSYDGSHDGADDYREQKPWRPAGGRARPPLLVIFGAEDDIADPKSAQDYRIVPQARIVTLDGTGHSPHVEKPAATNRLIQQLRSQQQGR